MKYLHVLENAAFYSKSRKSTGQFEYSSPDLYDWDWIDTLEVGIYRVQLVPLKNNNGYQLVAYKLGE